MHFVDNLSDDQKSLYVALWEKAVACLARRDYSVKSLRERLIYHSKVGKVSEIISNAELDDSDVFVVAAQVLNRAVDMGYLDEQRFTQMFIRSRQSRGYGPGRIKLELNEHGIDISSDVDEQLDQRLCNGGDPWVDKIVTAISRRSKWKSLDQPDVRAKVQRHFYAKGFSAEQINRAIAVVNGGIEDFG